MKVIVTHISVDLDSITSVWLVRRFLPGWSKAEIAYVPAGSTLDDQPVDKDLNIIHVDTGLGVFDHHQYDSREISASKLVFDFLIKKNYLDSKDIEALSRLLKVVTSIDHFGEVAFADPTNDIWEFHLSQIAESLKPVLKKDTAVVEFVSTILDAILLLIKKKIKAEKDIQKGYVFHSRWGKTIAMESKNEETLKLAQKMGYTLVIRRDPDRKNIRIKSPPGKNLDLTRLYEEITKIDKKGTWYFHVSKTMLLNGSSKNPKAIPSPLSLPKVIEIVKEM